MIAFDSKHFSHIKDVSSLQMSSSEGGDYDSDNDCVEIDAYIRDAVCQISDFSDRAEAITLARDTLDACSYEIRVKHILDQYYDISYLRGTPNKAKEQALHSVNDLSEPYPIDVKRFKDILTLAGKDIIISRSLLQAVSRLLCSSWSVYSHRHCKDKLSGVETIGVVVTSIIFPVSDVIVTLTSTNCLESSQFEEVLVLTYCEMHVAESVDDYVRPEFTHGKDDRSDFSDDDIYVLQCSRSGMISSQGDCEWMYDAEGIQKLSKHLCWSHNTTFLLRILFLLLRCECEGCVGRPCSFFLDEDDSVEYLNVFLHTLSDTTAVTASINHDNKTFKRKRKNEK